MLPVERQNRIRELIQAKRNMKISELSEELQVSDMTIHRDLKDLLEEGMIVKTFGGITLAQHSEQPSLESTADTCVICSRSVQERLAYRLILTDNRIEMACCAHCGLIRHRQLGDNILQAITHDFLRHTTISAVQSWYVMDTSVHMGCCQPQVLVFDWREDAEKFVKGFGGTVHPFSEIIDNMFDKMKAPHSDGCHHQDKKNN